ncbi:ATP-binding protein [uncultured Croceitalea sp.]|uniref:ATP-binding protein n=1 Tax=uncultured Croceitalea sp. TaxID=1798908 RepID=UPI003305EAC4
MDTRELLSHLAKLENGLDDFSFTELSTAEASALKRTFASFKHGLEEKVFGASISVPSSDVKSKQYHVDSKVQGTFQESTLIANVSHEIRTPLNGVLGFIDLLKDTSLSSKQSELVTALDKASNNLMDIINELLEYSKLAAGHEKFEKVPFNLANMIGEVAFLCKTLITSKDVLFKVHIDKSIPEKIIGDPSKLSQILLNLLGNAVKFVDNGAITLQVNLKSNKKNRVHLEFLVSDTGIGIANDKLKHIFDSYAQAESDTHLKYGGSGLGLSIVKEIVDNLKGCIAVNSTLGKGTTFKVILPFQKVDLLTDDFLPKVKENDTSREIDLTGKRVLVFEDNIMNQKLMENRLKTWGCDTFITDNGIYGLKLLENHQFDIVLMDLRMPKMNGYEITERIRQSKDSTISKIPIIALSADFSATDKKECKTIGITDFILKPYNAEELKGVIYDHISKSSAHISNSGTTSTKNDKALVNIEAIYAECMGQSELLDELVRLFKQNIFEFIGKVKMHLQSSNFQGIGFAAHKIKSSLKMLEATSLLSICEKISEVCKTGNDKNYLNFLYHQFLDEYPNVEHQIDEQIERLSPNNP